MIGALLLALLVAPPPAGAAESDRLFTEALECRGYTQMLSALGDPATGRRIHAYWVEHSNALGAARGLTAEQTDLRHLVIAIEPDKAKPILQRCVAATPREASGLK